MFRFYKLFFLVLLTSLVFSTCEIEEVQANNNVFFSNNHLFFDENKNSFDFTVYVYAGNVKDVDKIIFPSFSLGSYSVTSHSSCPSNPFKQCYSYHYSINSLSSSNYQIKCQFTGSTREETTSLFISPDNQPPFASSIRINEINPNNLSIDIFAGHDNTKVSGFKVYLYKTNYQNSQCNFSKSSTLFLDMQDIENLYYNYSFSITDILPTCYKFRLETYDIFSNTRSIESNIFHYDKLAPTTSAVEQDASHVSLLCQDIGSGCNSTFYTIVDRKQSCPTNYSVYNEYQDLRAIALTYNQKACFFSVDRDNNTELIKSFVFTSESNPPQILISPLNKISSNQIQVNITCSDSESGIAECKYILNSTKDCFTNGFQILGSILIKNGQTDLTVCAMDKSGNTLTKTAGPYIVDKTPPTTRAEKSQGNSVSLMCTDNLEQNTCSIFYKIVDRYSSCNASGLFTPFLSPINLNYWSKLCFYSTDSLGNKEQTSEFVLDPDQTPPIITVNPVKSFWSDNVSYVTLNCTDEPAGLSYCKAAFDVNNCKQAKQNTTINVSSLKSGSHFLLVCSQDQEGNFFQKTFGPYQIDKSPPTTFVKKQANSIFLQCFDNNQSGCSQTFYKIIQRQQTCPIDKYEIYKNQSIPIDYNSKICFYSVDKNANKEAINSFETGSDTTPPYLSINPMSSNWTNQILQINLQCSDSESGINQCKYLFEENTNQTNNTLFMRCMLSGFNLNISNPHNVSQSILISNQTGRFRLILCASDNESNTNLKISQVYRLDNIAPSTNLTINSLFNFSVELSCYDLHSGCSNISYKITSVNNTCTPSLIYTGPLNFSFDQQICYRSKDIAGNTESIHTFDFYNIISNNYTTCIRSKSVNYNDFVNYLYSNKIINDGKQILFLYLNQTLSQNIDNYLAHAKDVEKGFKLKIQGCLKNAFNDFFNKYFVFYSSSNITPCLISKGLDESFVLNISRASISNANSIVSKYDTHEISQIFLSNKFSLPLIDSYIHELYDVNLITDPNIYICLDFTPPPVEANCSDLSNLSKQYLSNPNNLIKKSFYITLFKCKAQEIQDLINAKQLDSHSFSDLVDFFTSAKHNISKATPSSLDNEISKIISSKFYQIYLDKQLIDSKIQTINLYKKQALIQKAYAQYINTRHREILSILMSCGVYVNPLYLFQYNMSSFDPLLIQLDNKRTMLQNIRQQLLQSGTLISDKQLQLIELNYSSINLTNESNIILNNAYPVSQMDAYEQMID